MILDHQRGISSFIIIFLVTSLILSGISIYFLKVHRYSNLTISSSIPFVMLTNPLNIPNNLYEQLINKLPVQTQYSALSINDDNTLTQFLRQKALSYLLININSINYSNASYLTRMSGKRFDYTWFTLHKSPYAIAKDGNFIINWIGLPGCEQDISQPGGADYGPNYFDVNKKRCYMLYSVNVELDRNYNPKSVSVDEVGGVT